MNLFKRKIKEEKKSCYFDYELFIITDTQQKLVDEFVQMEQVVYDNCYIDYWIYYKEKPEFTSFVDLQAFINGLQEKNIKINIISATVGLNKGEKIVYKLMFSTPFKMLEI